MNPIRPTRDDDHKVMDASLFIVVVKIGICLGYYFVYLNRYLFTTKLKMTN